MRKLISTLVVALGLLVPVSASAVSSYKLPASYRAVYCYPTGSYWQTQLAAYPEYYAAYGSYFSSLYGAGTMYCD